MNNVFRLVYSVYDRNPYIFKVNIFTHKNYSAYSTCRDSSLHVARWLCHLYICIITLFKNRCAEV